MAILSDETKYPVKILLLIGIPAFLVAALISIVSHQYAHIIVNKMICGTAIKALDIADLTHLPAAHYICPLAAAAGPLWTFMLALASFGFYMHNPRNLFAAAMAFVNASARLPETITVFLQLLFHRKTTLLVDETYSLDLIRLKDPTAAVVILCFFSLIILFLTITIIHDTKTIPWKWLVAIVLLALIGPIENIMWKVVAPLIV